MSQDNPSKDVSESTGEAVTDDYAKNMYEHLKSRAVVEEANPEGQF